MESIQVELTEWPTFELEEMRKRNQQELNTTKEMLFELQTLVKNENGHQPINNNRVKR